ALHKAGTNHKAPNGQPAKGDAWVPNQVSGSWPPQDGDGILLHYLNLSLQGADCAAGRRELPPSVRTPAILTRQIIRSIRSTADALTRIFRCMWNLRPG